jgi:unsaturated rhamnogalacturonyl hydrolase
LSILSPSGRKTEERHTIEPHQPAAQGVRARRLESIIIEKDESEQRSISDKMNNWEWESGVALFAVYLYYRKTNRKDLPEYLIKWFDDQIKKGLPGKNVNTVCPLLTLTYIYEKENGKEYLPLCKEWLECHFKGLMKL